MPTKELHIDQSKMLREEVMTLIDETRKLELYTVGAVAALYAWLITEGQNVSREAYLIAPALVGLGAIRAVGLFIRLTQIGVYLRRIEANYFIDPPELPGWERYLAAQRMTPLAPTAVAFWLVSLTLTLMAPSYLGGS